MWIRGQKVKADGRPAIVLDDLAWGMVRVLFQDTMKLGIVHESKVYLKEKKSNE
jgi:hypothetical protein